MSEVNISIADYPQRFKVSFRFYSESVDVVVRFESQGFSHREMVEKVIAELEAKLNPKK